jgi:hypothetical protein
VLICRRVHESRDLDRTNGTPGPRTPGGPTHRRGGTIHPMDVGIVLIAILILVLVWRGPKTLPDLGKALGRGVKEARREASAKEDDTSDGQPGA